MVPSASGLEPGCRWLRIGLAAAALAVLGGCELIAHEGAPQAGAGCATWRGGCPAAIDYATVTTAPTLRAESRLAGNIAFAAAAGQRQCRSFPTGCQLGGLADTVEDRYLAPPR